jgi:hypothetical protein
VPFVIQYSFGFCCAYAALRNPQIPLQFEPENCKIEVLPVPLRKLPAYDDRWRNSGLVLNLLDNTNREVWLK